MVAKWTYSFWRKCPFNVGPEHKTSFINKWRFIALSNYSMALKHKSYTSVAAAKAAISCFIAPAMAIIMMVT